MTDRDKMETSGSSRYDGQYSIGDLWERRVIGEGFGVALEGLKHIMERTDPAEVSRQLAKPESGLNSDELRTLRDAAECLTARLVAAHLEVEPTSIVSQKEGRTSLKSTDSDELYISNRQGSMFFELVRRWLDEDVLGRVATKSELIGLLDAFVLSQASRPVASDPEIINTKIERLLMVLNTDGNINDALADQVGVSAIALRQNRYAMAREIADYLNELYGEHGEEGLYGDSGVGKAEDGMDLVAPSHKDHLRMMIEDGVLTKDTMDAIADTDEALELIKSLAFDPSSQSISFNEKKVKALLSKLCEDNLSVEDVDAPYVLNIVRRYVGDADTAMSVKIVNSVCFLGVLQESTASEFIHIRSLTKQGARGQDVNNARNAVVYGYMRWRALRQRKEEAAVRAAIRQEFDSIVDTSYRC